MFGGTAVIENHDRNIVLTARCIQTLKTLELTQQEMAVLWTLVASLPPAGLVVPNVEIARRLSIDAAHVSRAMKRLCEMGFIMRGPKVSLSYHYKLNPAFFRILS